MVKYPAMHLLPKNKQEWLNTVLFPLKAYTVIAPTLFVISVRLPRPRHSGATDMEVFLAMSLGVCSVILLLMAVVLALVGQKVHALSCLGFAIAEFLIGGLLTPSLAS